MITRKDLQAAAAEIEKKLDNMGYDIMVRHYTMYDGRIGYGFYYRLGGMKLFATGTGTNELILHHLHGYFKLITSNPEKYK